MKLKNIPDNIRTKSIKEAQNEIKELITKLESNEINLEDSTEQYNRIVQLNSHIQEEFRKKAAEIKKTKINRNEKILQKE